MNDDQSYKYPRLFVTQKLLAMADIQLDLDQTHYLKNVLRRQSGDPVRLFNGQDGEWLCSIQGFTKKTSDIIIERQLRAQTEDCKKISLLFSPIKKQRLDILIEKAVELGVGNFCPVLSQNTEIRKINEERLRKQIFEAAEQCERLTIPTLHPLQTLSDFLRNCDQGTPIYSCIERFEAPHIRDFQGSGDVAVLIGPEGGFTQEEKQHIAEKTTPVSLGKTVLRCETAAIKALCLLGFE